MTKKFMAQLITNFQPRMNLGRKRFNEEREVSEEASNYNKQIAMEHERERLKDQMEKRKEPSEAKILGPSDSEVKNKQGTENKL